MLLSIITVNLNNAEGLERTARSIVEQTCQDYEWIVIDGGSTDGSVDIIKKYSDHITYWVSEPDKGIYNAMNKGIAQAHGDYLQFLNSGDWYYDSQIIFALQRNNKQADIYYGDSHAVDNLGNGMFFYHSPDCLTLDYFLNHNLCHQSIFYKRKCFDYQGFDETFKICADYKKNILLFLDGFRYSKIEKVIVNYNTSGISSTQRDLTDEEKNACLIEVFPKSVLLSEYTKAQKLLNNISKYQSSDIEMKTREIFHKGKIARYLLRIWLYPIHKLLS